MSTDIFSFQHDHRFSFDPSALQYHFQFDVVAGNAPPVANAGPNQTVAVGETVALDGSGSGDIDGDSLTFQWTLENAPASSTASLSNANAAMSTFVPDVAGDYLAELVVNVGAASLVSAPVAVIVMADPLPGITSFSRTFGAGLQVSGSPSLAIPNYGGVTVRIGSSYPAVALVAPDGTTPCSAFIDFFVADGNTAANYTVQGVAGAARTATIAASALGFANGTGIIDVVQPAFSIQALSSEALVGVNDVFAVLIGTPNSAGTGLSGFQGTSAANVPPLGLMLTSSDDTAGEIGAGGMSVATLSLSLPTSLYTSLIRLRCLSGLQCQNKIAGSL